MEEELKKKSKNLYNSSDKNYSSKSGGFSENRIAKSLFEIPKETRSNSCKIIKNFVPRLHPKKSFCKPSLFILNNDDLANKKKEQQIEKNLLLIQDSDGNSSGLDSLEETEENNYINNNLELLGDKDVNNKDAIKYKNNIDKFVVYKEKDFNLENKLKSDFDDNKNDDGANDDKNNKYNGNEEYLSILDILSHNYK